MSTPSTPPPLFPTSISPIPTLVTFPEPTDQNGGTIVDTSPTPACSPVSNKRQKTMRCDGNICYLE